MTETFYCLTGIGNLSPATVNKKKRIRARAQGYPSVPPMLFICSRDLRGLVRGLIPDRPRRSDALKDMRAAQIAGPCRILILRLLPDLLCKSASISATTPAQELTDHWDRTNRGNQFS